MGKLNSQIDRSELLKAVSTERTIEEVQSIIPHGTTISINSRNLIDYLNYLKNEAQNKFDYRVIDPFNISESLKSSIIKIAFSIIERYESDFFKIKQSLESLSSIHDIETLRDQISKLNIATYFEELYTFDDTVNDSIWEIQMKVSNKKGEYNATEIGFLIWTFSKAIETIDDIEVYIEKWGDGSKWFTLKLRIKNYASKVDLKEVLKKSRQSIEVVYTKKPTDEIQKFEAEKNKLDAEAKKIKKESDNIMDSETAKIVQELNIQNQILELQKKEIDIEDKKADLLLKKLQAINQLSEIIKNGVIQNDSNIQIMINDMLYLNKEEGKISYVDIEYIDTKEKIEKKSEKGS